MHDWDPGLMCGCFQNGGNDHSKNGEEVRISIILLDPGSIMVLLLCVFLILKCQLVSHQGSSNATASI